MAGYERVEDALFGSLQVVHADGKEDVLRVPRVWMEKKEKNVPRKLKPRTDMLVVLNPVGTLMYIETYQGNLTFVRRPYMDGFMNYLLDHMYVMWWMPNVSDRVAAAVVDQLLGVRKFELEAIWNASSLPQTRNNLAEDSDTSTADIDELGLSPVWQQLRGGRRWGRQNSIMLSLSKQQHYRSTVSDQLDALHLKALEYERRRSPSISLDGPVDARPVTAPAVTDATAHIAAPNKAVCNAWRKETSAEHDQEMLDLIAYFNRAIQARFGAAHFFRSTPYNCGWKGSNDRARFGRQTEAGRRSVCDA